MRNVSVFEKMEWLLIFETDYLFNFFSGPKIMEEGSNVLPRKCLQFHSSHVNILVCFIVFVIERTPNSEWICFLSVCVCERALI